MLHATLEGPSSLHQETCNEACNSLTWREAHQAKIVQHCCAPIDTFRMLVFPAHTFFNASNSTCPFIHHALCNLQRCLFTMSLSPRGVKDQLAAGHAIGC